MDKNIIKAQTKLRDKLLRDVVRSKAKKKIIVAGPGTGKTYTFKKIIEADGSKNNLVLTFIRRLVEDMNCDFGATCEVKTFHAFCKKILHKVSGKVDLFPYLTDVIQRDAQIMGYPFNGFDEKFQTLNVKNKDIKFYLARGDYYNYLSFNDSVYRLYCLLKKKNIIGKYKNIIIDEFQDFNKLEVEFINVLSKLGSILIVGDDDQAIYNDRFASPKYLRQLYLSKSFKKYELPFCSRCPKVIVDATNALVKKATDTGYFRERINKKYESFIGDKMEINRDCPKILLRQCTTAPVVAKYISSEIGKIKKKYIDESWGNNYPTVLIVGQKQYLVKIYEVLSALPNVSYKPNVSEPYTIIDGYKILLHDSESNLGWRIVTEFTYDERGLKTILKKAINKTSFKSLLSKSEVQKQINIINLIKKYIKDTADKKDFATLKLLTDNNYDIIIEGFKKVEEKQEVVDKTKPSVLLTSFKGCKGLSASFVFMVGVNNGSIPKNINTIENVEISQYIVALTRTRVQCTILCNKWLISPKDKKGLFISPYVPSIFINWLPKVYYDSKPCLKSSDIT